MRALATRLDSLPPGYADAAVIACAERSGGRVLTPDRRDFVLVVRDGTIEILPEDHNVS